ncbi:MAG TPA: hypothetical protein VLF69_02365 [Candidatus Saccharimonadales bacterium]|nr:hypothetical protein [Candidatus Saccharimonadales bacterium]
MAKAQAEVGRWRRFFGWFGRHKVTAVFAVLFVGLGMYLLVSAAVLQLQIHAERSRYEKADQQLNQLSAKLASTHPYLLRPYHYCSYTSNGAVFATRFLGCEVGFHEAYIDIPEQNAQVATDEIKDMIKAESVPLRDSPGGYDKYDLAVYGFDLQEISCVFSSTYYSSIVPLQERYKYAPRSGNALYIDIGCSGPAKAEYFPVVND